MERMDHSKDKVEYANGGLNTSACWAIQRNEELAELRKIASADIQNQATIVTNAYFEDADKIHADYYGRSVWPKTLETLQKAKSQIKDEKDYKLFQNLLCHQINVRERQESLRPNGRIMFFNDSWNTQRPGITSRHGEIEVSFLDITADKKPGLVQGSIWRHYDGSVWSNLDVKANNAGSVVAWLSSDHRIPSPDRVQILNENQLPKKKQKLSVSARIISNDGKLMQQVKSESTVQSSKEELPSRTLICTKPKLASKFGHLQINEDLKVFKEPGDSTYTTNFVAANKDSHGIVRFSFKEKINDLPIASLNYSEDTSRDAEPKAIIPKLAEQLSLPKPVDKAPTLQVSAQLKDRDIHGYIIPLHATALSLRSIKKRILGH